MGPARNGRLVGARTAPIVEAVAPTLAVWLGALGR